MSILVAGALHLDVVVRAAHLPALDETLTGQGVDYVFGGKGGNQAVAAARMGAQVSFVGRVGGDAFGAQLREGLVRTGVDISQLQADPGPSGMSTAIVTDTGEYGAVIVSAANLNIAVDALSVPPGTRLILLQNEVPEAVNLALAGLAKADGAAVWLNAAPARTLSPELAACVDMLIVNRVEAGFYGDAFEQSRVLTTLGADGVMYREATYPAHRVDVHSTHGAGDVFVGALAAEVAGGAPVETAIGFAQAAAALHVSAPQAGRSTLSRKTVLRFLAAQPSP